MTKLKILLSPPDVGITEAQAATRAVESGWVAPLGPELDAFEEELKNYTGAGEVVGLSSGTAAIHLALKAMGISRGDVVLLQSFTFAGSANPVMYLGGEPVFVGSEATTWNICPNAIEDAIKGCIKKGKHPKALILVHLYGMPALLSDIMSVCSKYNIPVLEDAAESLGSSITCPDSGKVMTGCKAEMGILSFNGNKLITTSGGGAVLCKDRKIADYIRFLSTQAKDPAPHYQHSEIGYNYRLSNILAAIGRAQLETIERKIAIRREHYEFYAGHLCLWEGVAGLNELDGVRSNRWLSTFTFDKKVYQYDKSDSQKLFREELRLYLAELGIESRPLWKPLHLQPVFKECDYYGSGIEEELFDIGLCLPSGSSMTREQREYVTDSINKYLKAR
jgi:dTDP-4-amino-4,6-dideoxygalactose transaminase